MSSEDIVISGLGTRLPESRNTDHYWKNLVEGVDCVTNKNDRWPDGMQVDIELILNLAQLII